MIDRAWKLVRIQLLVVASDVLERGHAQDQAELTAGPKLNAIHIQDVRSVLVLIDDDVPHVVGKHVSNFENAAIASRVKRAQNDRYLDRPFVLPRRVVRVTK